MNLFIHFIKNFIRIISFNYFFYETLDDKIKHENFVKYAKKEDSEALFELSKLYLNTESFDFSDLSFGIYILKKSFELGHQESGTKLSNICLHIYSRTKNIDFFNTALNINLTLAKNGNVEANLFLGFYYENNSEYKKSLSYFKAAAKQNNPSALLALAFMYKDGKGVDIDNDKYLYLLKKSAENNLDDAQYLLGKIYLEKGQISAITELLINEDKNEDTNNSIYNFNCAKEWFEKAAKQEHIGATYLLAILLIEGEQLCIEANINLGIDLLLINAKKEDSQSQYQLGRIYYEGNYVTQNFSYAKEWFEKAAKNGSLDAEYFLGILYLNGEGVKQSYSDAKEWFGKSCEHGNQEACNEYAKLNKKGY